MKKEIFYGRNIDGVPTIPRSKALKEAMSAFGDTHFQLILEKKRIPPTKEERGVLHWYCTALAKHLGMEMKEFKAVMAEKYIKKAQQDENGNDIFDPETGALLMYVPSTEDLNKFEYFEFTEKIRLWALDFISYELPLPDKNWKLFQILKDEHK